MARTERGVKEPQATFSTCFGAPFMALNPTVYAKLLGEKMGKHRVCAWLINTGWNGGPDGMAAGSNSRIRGRWCMQPWTAGWRMCRCDGIRYSE